MLFSPSISIIYIVLLLALFAVWILSSAHKLTFKQADFIRITGIVHYTTLNCADNILATQKIDANNKEHKAYFFVNEPISRNVLKYNRILNSKKVVKITVCNLTIEQVKRLKQRIPDGALECKDGFVIVSQNTVFQETVDHSISSYSFHKAFSMSFFYVAVGIVAFCIFWILGICFIG